MIIETGQVIRTQDGYIWVETSVKSTCNTCAAKANCGTGAIADAIAGKTLVNKVLNDKAAKVGDAVEIGIPEETLLLGSFYLYVLPLISAVIFALLGSIWLTRFIDLGEGFTILLTFIGGGLGFYYAKFKLKEDRIEAEPKLVKVLTSGIKVKEIQS